MPVETVPRLPVFGWPALRGAREAGVPSLLDLPGMGYTTSGRASILLALEALGVKAGDGVLLPTYHCPTMIAPAVNLGAVPIFYPIDTLGAPDLGWLENQAPPRARVLLAAHFFGVPQPMAALRAWCDGRGIALIEDCAHALFGHAGERPVGAWGDIAIGSLTKFLPVNEGGCLVVNGSAALPRLTPCGARVQLKSAIDILEVGAQHRALPGLNGLIAGGLAGARRLAGQGGVADSATDARPDMLQEPPPPASAPDATTGPLPPDFVVDATLAHQGLSWPARAIADRLPRERVVELRRRHFEWLHQRLKGRPGLHPLLPGLPTGCVPYVYPLWVQNPDPGYAELRRLGLPVFRWDRLWPGVPELPRDRGLQWSHHVLQLACHQDLSEADLERFLAAILRLCASPTSPEDRAAGRPGVPVPVT